MDGQGAVGWFIVDTKSSVGVTPCESGGLGFGFPLSRE